MAVEAFEGLITDNAITENSVGRGKCERSTGQLPVCVDTVVRIISNPLANARAVILLYPHNILLQNALNPPKS
jgi:hypothetical protein